MDSIDVCYAVLDLGDARLSATQLRGYLGYVFADTPEFHHHMEDSYHYPLVQYKRLRCGKYLVMGLGAFAQILYQKIKDIDHITTKSQKIQIRNIEISMRHITIKNSRPIKYNFVTDWIALNKQNYEKYDNIQNKREFLEGILVGNILSACKGLGVHVDFPIMVDIVWFRAKNTIAHLNSFVGFRCKFRANVSLIPNMGLGKSVSKGFGMIEKIDS